MLKSQEYHSFKVSFASTILSNGKMVGVENAIFLQDIAYWCDYNRSSGINFNDGRYWTYGTMDAICERHPYWTKKQVRRIIASCKEMGLLLLGNYNKSNYDRTLWYSVSDEVLEILGLIEWANASAKSDTSICPNGQMEDSNRANGSSQMGTPIPYTKNIYKKQIDKTYIDIAPGEIENGQMEADETPLISFPMREEPDYIITESMVDELKRQYPSIDIMNELKRMKDWLTSHKTRRRTTTEISKFINSWLSNAERRNSHTREKSFYELALEMEANGEL